MRRASIFALGVMLSAPAAWAADPFQSNTGPPAPAPRRPAPRAAPEAEMAAPPAAPAANRYDGHWAVFLACPQASDGAGAFSWSFAADVRNGLLHGQYRTPTETPYMTLDGPIQPGGSAQFQARGLSGIASYTYTGSARGTPFSHDVTASFDTARGTGTWTAGRTCNLTFTKQ